MTTLPATCGQGLAAQSHLPASLADVMDGVAAVLEAHMAALDLDDPAAAQEHGAYRALAARHRRVAEELASIAEQLSGFRDLPMGRHDEQAMQSDAAGRSFEQFVRAEVEMLSVLQKQVAEHRTMLVEMQGDEQ